MSRVSGSSKHWYDKYYLRRGRSAPAWYDVMYRWLAKQKPDGPIVELGCGAGELLERLADDGVYMPSELYGVEQSTTGLENARRLGINIVDADLSAGVPFENASAGCVVLAEVIEHLVDADSVLSEVDRILRPDGVFLLSFPNYINLPWLVVRVLADMLDRPNWIVLQPVDRMYTIHAIVNKLKRAGFKVSACFGTVYLPPILYKWEHRYIRAAFDRLGLADLAFHPILVCRKRRIS